MSKMSSLYDPSVPEPKLGAGVENRYGRLRSQSEPEDLVYADRVGEIHEKFAQSTAYVTDHVQALSDAERDEQWVKDFFKLYDSVHPLIKTLEPKKKPPLMDFTPSYLDHLNDDEEKPSQASYTYTYILRNMYLPVLATLDVEDLDEGVRSQIIRGIASRIDYTDTDSSKWPALKTIFNLDSKEGTDVALNLLKKEDEAEISKYEGHYLSVLGRIGATRKLVESKMIEDPEFFAFQNLFSIDAGLRPTGWLIDSNVLLGLKYAGRVDAGSNRVFQEGNSDYYTLWGRQNLDPGAYLKYLDAKEAKTRFELQELRGEVLKPEEVESERIRYYVRFNEHENVILRGIADAVLEGDVPAESIYPLMERVYRGRIKDYEIIFDSMEVGASTDILLNGLKSDKARVRTMCAELLYRKELGKMAISADGLEYLGKLYKLGEYNDPEFFARRLANSGLMGVLASDGSIKGVFQLDIESREAVIEAQVRQLLVTELFIPKSDETPEQRDQREEYLKLFLENYESVYKDDFFAGTGVRLNSLDLHEQGWFLLYYTKLSQSQDGVGLERLKGFVKRFGETGLKSFLALEYGGSGEGILEFAEAEHLSDEDKSKIFQNYYTIAAQAMTWRSVFDKLGVTGGYDFGSQVHEAFVRKNSEFFLAAQKIANGEGGDVSITELLEGMSSVTKALVALRGLYDENTKFVLDPSSRSEAEYDSEGNLLPDAATSYILTNRSTGDRIVVTIRPTATTKSEKRSGGEARINFTVIDSQTKSRTRVGFDMDSSTKTREANNGNSRISLDLGLGITDRVTKTWATSRVGRILNLVEGSEGGHNASSFRPDAVEHFSDIAQRLRNYMNSRFSKE